MIWSSHSNSLWALKKLLALIAFSVLLLVPVGAQNAFAGDPNGCVDDSDCIDGDGVCFSGERCDTGSGMCVNVDDPPLSTLCDTDGDACTVQHCDGEGSCVFLSPVVCNDDDICNGEEICDPATGCVSVPPTAPLCAVGGEIIPIGTTSLILAGTQSAFSWMIPITVSAVGIAIVIARKFSKYQPE